MPSQTPRRRTLSPHDPTADTASSTAAPPAGRRPTSNADENIKETFESVIIAFVLAFVFRAYVVEAFVIPTGSMAPTLLGAHATVTCQQCGYRFDVDWPDRNRRDNALVNDLSTAMEAICPMCGYRSFLQPNARASAGDRILVHKFIYSIDEPRRWDVVVFKDPQNPTQNFIKRLIGLPDENIAIIDGNIYVKGSHEPASAWRIARKSDRPKVQRAVWQPIYHSDFIPLDGGQPSSQFRVGTRTQPWRVPWVPRDPQAWDVDGRRSYRHGSAEAGAIDFDFSRTAAGRFYYYVYDQFSLDRLGPEPIEDVRLSAAFQPETPGLDVTLSTWAHTDLKDPEAGRSAITGRIDPDGVASLRANGQTLAQINVGTFVPGVARRVELWHVDQEASLWVDGKCVLRHKFDFDVPSIVMRRPPDYGFPKISIAVAGAPVTLHHVELDRDLFYISTTYPPQGRRSGQPGLASIIKDRSIEPFALRGQPARLAPDEFFCLGDNSPMSSDGRFWQAVDPWIAYRMGPQVGVVPRKLMLGRAFFVYFPAPHRLKGQGLGLIPNFGDMRFIH